MIASRRSYDRFITDGSSSVKVNGIENSWFILKNLGPRGIAIVSKNPFKKDEKLEINMLVPFFNLSVVKKAKVVWCNAIEDNLFQSGLDFGIDNLIELSRDPA